MAWHGRPRAVWIGLTLVVFVVVALLWNAQRPEQPTFSQRPGFVRYFELYPPSSALPNVADRALLEAHRPVVYLPAGHEGPIDFYADYLAHGVLYDASGRVVEEGATPETVRRLARDPKVVFVHQPPATIASQTASKAGRVPPVYASLQRVGLTFELGPNSRDSAVAHTYLFLRYHLVFRVSGLPDGLAWWQAMPLSWVASLEDWHQLDHYTAVAVVLNPQHEAIAMVLQQHNYQRTYLIGESIELTPEGRVAIDVALRSNELYPHRATRTRHRAVRFITPPAMRYLLTGEDPPLLSADDVTNPDRRLAYRLAYLAPDDPFYLFAGTLGEERLLPGRDGPPGAEFNTLPEFKPWPVALGLGYWRDDHAGDLARWSETQGTADVERHFARAQLAVLGRNLACLKAQRRECVLD